MAPIHFEEAQAGDLDRAAMLLDDPQRDGQSQSWASRLAAARRLAAVEGGESRDAPTAPEIPGAPVVDDCLNTPLLLAHGHARLLAVARRVADDVRERENEDGSPVTRNGPPSSRRSVTAPRARRVASVGMGDLLLADAGLRKNRRPPNRGAVARRP